MKTDFKKNEMFLRNLYSKGPFQGHAFVAMAGGVPGFKWEDGDFTISRRPVDKWLPWVVENHARGIRLHAAVQDDGVPCASLMTGTHIYAAAFGCRVHASEDNAPCAVPLVRTAAEADRLKEPDLWKTPVLSRIFELAQLVRQELGPEVCLSPCDMQSGFDTACLIWNKEDLFRAMLDPNEQAAVQRLVDKCARLFKRFLTEFRKAFPNCSPCHCPGSWCPPEMGPWLSNDECGNFNQEIFARFCLPELLDLAETFGGLGMHCCASAEHQFPLFKRIPNFYGFNRVPARKGWNPLLEHFGGASAPVHNLAWISDEDTEALIQKAPPGMRFVFNLLGADVDQARAWYEKMRRISPRQD